MADAEPPARQPPTLLACMLAELMRTAVACLAAWIYWEVVPDSIGLGLKLGLLFGLTAVVLCGWFYWRDRRTR